MVGGLSGWLRCLEEGWHTGFWRDLITGLDNGIRQLFSSKPDKANRKTGLLEIIYTLDEEVRQKSRGVVTIWHDEVTSAMLKADKIQVIEISAGNANEAKTKLKELINCENS